jgi:hypothetical protein
MFACVLMVALPGAALGVDCSVDLSEGDTLRYTISQSVDVTQRTGESDSVVEKHEHYARVVLEVEELLDGGVMDVSMRFEMVLLGIEQDGATAAYVATMEDGAIAAVPPQGEGERDETLTEIGDELLRSVVRLRVTPVGAVEVESGLEAFLQRIGGQDAYDERVAGFFTPARLGEMLEPIFEGAPDGADEREVGKGWQGIDEVSLGRAGTVEMINAWRFASLQDGLARFEGDLRVELMLPVERPADVPELRIPEASGETTVLWDVAEGRLGSRTGTQSIVTNWTLGDATLVQQQESETQIVRVASGGG